MKKQLCRFIICSITFVISVLINYGFEVTNASATFTNVTASAGLGKVGASYDNPMWGDFNNDDNPDILIQHHVGPLSLYLNNGSGKFINIIGTSGITPVTGVDRHGMAWGDYDNDGNLDIYITDGACMGNCIGGKSDELWKGNGQGKFINVTTAAGVANSSGRGRSAYWVDYNNDGLLDLFVLNYNTNSVMYRNNGNGTFTNVASATGLMKITGKVCSWADYNNDGAMDILVTGVVKDRLFRNDPISHIFTDITTQAGLLPRIGMGTAWGDYNNDGLPDLHVSRGIEKMRDVLIWNASKITFLDEENLEDGVDFTTNSGSVTFDLYISNLAQKGMIFIGGNKTNPASLPFTISASDPLLDGMPAYTRGVDTGYYIWKDNTGTWHLRYSGYNKWPVYYGVITGNGSFTSVVPTFTPARLQFKDTLYKNNGNGTFTDVTDSAGVGKFGNHQTSAFGDFNNDGFIDLYTVEAGDISGSKPNLLYKNNGNGTFTNVAVYNGIDAGNIQSRHFGAAWGDYNNDGFLDLFMKNGVGMSYPLATGSDVLYRNNGNNSHWLKVKLTGTQSNRSAIGAKLILNINGQIQYREVNSGGELHSQGNVPVHFGTGAATAVNSLIIKWPSGLTQILTNIPANQTLRVVE
ncbi:MAG: CRTAC1 family protein [Nitrospirae bacterium]|nr:CRTAC1 family protein [Nitrospirota bacterium]